MLRRKYAGKLVSTLDEEKKNMKKVFVESQIES